jgi:K+-sensing histidine kinase KdpD
VGDLRVAVGDDRIGTDVDHLRRLISDVETDSPPLDAGGWTHGLGLAICSRLVRAARGRISVAGRTASGTVFTVELPFRRL